VNTSNNTVMKSVVGSLFNTNIITDFSYSTSATMPTFGAYVIYCLPNGNFWIDFLNTNASYPYSVVYDPSGRKILENNGISSTYSMTSDSSYVYGFNSAGIMSKYTLEGAYIPDLNINTNMWFISVAYCPVDGFIYGARNGSPNEIYRINRETGSKTLFRTPIVTSTAGITGLAFNSDYSYLYYMTIGNGYIYYIERTNISNTNTVKTTTNADATIGSITATLTMNRASNILYSVDDNTPGKIYYFKLLTATTCEPAAFFYTLTNNSTRAIHYSDITNKLYIAPNGERKLYIFSPINTLSYLNVPNSALFNGTNNLQIQRNTTNFGNLISFNTTLSSDSYTINPLHPNYSDNMDTFDIVYTTNASLTGDASYTLINNNTGSVIKTLISSLTALSFTNIPSDSLMAGTNILSIKRNDVSFGNPITVNATCFMEGTRILCLTETYEEEYVKIETIKPGMLVKTHLHGFKPVHSIGKGTIYNPSENTLTNDRLYVISKNKCPALTDDLYITGNHSVLVPSLTDEQREKIVKYMKEIYITDDHYRLPACLDERFTEYMECGNKTIWHFALENDNIFDNYGVYANGGMLVETCSIRYLSELSALELQK
jgi:hypothetical protein